MNSAPLLGYQLRRASTAMLSTRRLIRRASGGGRSQELRASAAGETLAAQVEERIAAHAARFLPDLSGTERQTLVALLRQVWTA